VRSGKLLLQVVLKPLLGCMLLTLGTVSMATGMLDAMVWPAALALRRSPPETGASDCAKLLSASENRDNAARESNNRVRFIVGIKMELAYGDRRRRLWHRLLFPKSL